MDLQVEIHEQIVKKLSTTKEPCSGILYGINTKSTTLILGATVTDKPYVYSLPVGLVKCGFFITGENFDKSKLKKDNKNVSIENMVIIFGAINDKNNITVNIDNKGELEKIDFKIVNDDTVYSQYMFIRCKGGLPIKCEFAPSVISEHIKSLKNQLDNDNNDSKILFKLYKNQLFFSNNKVAGLENEDLKVGDLYKNICGSGDDSNRKKKAQTSLKPKVLDFEMLCRLTVDRKQKPKTEHAPVCILNKNSLTALDTVANIDTLAILSLDAEVSLLYPVLVQSVLCYLDLFEESLKTLEITAQEVKFEPFHFLPVDLSHFVTVLYLKNQAENVLKILRQTLHKNLLLDPIVPRFRRANKYLFESEMPSNGPLLNPHEGVKFTDDGGELALVRGKYQYYHYCQNNMDDNGWGCAYRSLQTVASWFKLQGYVDREVPTFHDIQKCLVDIKDKPSSFLGSRQWIGSTEVSFILNTLLGIDCKILFVSSGEEIGTKGPELVNHFRTQGAPIMIGGGVLAHTILGVEYNQSTGKLKFLILDPHYTGGEDLHTIQSKGWCCWKGLDFWDKRAYYNMCLPQVPRGV